MRGAIFETYSRVAILLLLKRVQPASSGHHHRLRRRPCLLPRALQQRRQLAARPRLLVRQPPQRTRLRLRSQTSLALRRQRRLGTFVRVYIRRVCVCARLGDATTCYYGPRRNSGPFTCAKEQ